MWIVKFASASGSGKQIRCSTPWSSQAPLCVSTGILLCQANGPSHNDAYRVIGCDVQKCPQIRVSHKSHDIRCQGNVEAPNLLHLFLSSSFLSSSTLYYPHPSTRPPSPQPLTLSPRRITRCPSPVQRQLQRLPATATATATTSANARLPKLHPSCDSPKCLPGRRLCSR